jgi:hypothetical protein
MFLIKFLTAHFNTQLSIYWLWLSKTKESNDLKAEIKTMAKAKPESQDHGSHDQSHGKAMAKTSRLSTPKSL